MHCAKAKLELRGRDTPLRAMDNVRHINLHRDDEAGVWWCNSGDIPGLVSEDTSLGSLISRVRQVAPELIEMNGGSTAGIRLEFRTESAGLPKAF